AHLEDVGADAIAGVVPLARDLLPRGQNRLGLADLEDHVALLDPVHDAAEDLALLARELGVDALAFRVPDLLQDHLFGRLGRDPTELLRRPLLLQLELVPQLGLPVECLGVGQADLELVVGHFLDDLLTAVDAQVATLAVDVHAHVIGRPQRLPRRRQQGRLQRLEEDLFVDPLLAPDLLDDADQLSVHRSQHLPEILRLARPGDFRLQTGLRDAGAREVHPLAVVLEHELVRLHRHESAAHLTPAGEPAAHALADRPAELALLAEDAIQPVVTQHRHHDLLDLVGLYRVVHRAFPLPVAKLKKAGNAHFFRNLARLEGRGKAGRGPAGLSPGFGGLDRADGVDDFVLGDAALLARLAGADLDQALLHEGVADRDAHGQAEEIGVLELHPGPLVAVVQHRLETLRPARIVDRLGGISLGLVFDAHADDVRVQRRDRPRPDDPVPVGELLDRGGGDPGRTDAVAPHDD